MTKKTKKKSSIKKEVDKETLAKIAVIEAIPAENRTDEDLENLVSLKAE